MNILDLEGEGLRLAAPPSATKVGIRPEDIEIGEPGTGMADCTVDVLEYLGADTFVIVDGGPLGQITVRTDGNTSARQGDRIGLMAPAESLHFFDAEGLAVPGN